LHFLTTNNVVEYEALVNGLCITTELGVQRLYICSDSKLIINQVMGESNCCDSCMVAYWWEVRKLEKKFDGFKLIMSFGKTTKQPTPSLGSGLAVNHPLWVC
jgi:ribonuclease HI